MDWWNDELTTTATQAAIWVVSALLALWKAGAFQLAREWAGTLQDTRIATGANKLINWADAELSGDRGAEKLDKVLATDTAQRLGIDRADVEAALAARDAAKAKSDQLAAELSAATSRITALEAQLASLASIAASPTAAQLAAVADQVAAAQATIGNAQELASRLRGGGV